MARTFAKIHSIENLNNAEIRGKAQKKTPKNLEALQDTSEHKGLINIIFLIAEVNNAWKKESNTTLQGEIKLVIAWLKTYVTLVRV